MKYLSLIFNASMNWREHINIICNKVTRRLNLLGRIWKYLDTDTCKLLYMTLVPGGGVILGISGWGYAASTLKPLAYIRASFSWILLAYTRVNSWFP